MGAHSYESKHNSNIISAHNNADTCGEVDERDVRGPGVGAHGQLAVDVREGEGKAGAHIHMSTANSRSMCGKVEAKRNTHDA